MLKFGSSSPAIPKLSDDAGMVDVSSMIGSDGHPVLSGKAPSGQHQRTRTDGVGG
jgi:hypothetical protein